LEESFKLNPWALDGCPRPKSGKTYMAPFWVENQLVWTQKKKRAIKRRACDLKNQDEARVQVKVQVKDSICFKQLGGLGIWTLDFI
jgi:hypothetical protein